ncbi:MAG TPA: extracellular solute-binding protein [Burkholderiaceae bacterium]|jgi:multiple sugar transport system substrate-binding protein|nr:extracellular solute-binding protein [Burkholderiaceae bacterium]
MSSNSKRRDLLKAAAGLAAGVPLAAGEAAAQAKGAGFTYRPEKGARLRVLRWKRFVQGDEDAFMANVKKFSDKFGVEVRVDNEGWEDVRPKAAVAANVGSGPDIIYGWFDDPHQYPDKLVDLSDVANYLGAKYGGWYDVARTYGMRDGKWIGLPLGAAGATFVHRISHVQAAGFKEFPKDTAGFLELCKAMKAKGTPAGFALGNAVGDGNSWVHWLVWAFGGKLVDEKGNVVINSPETIRALEYAKELYATFVPGTLSWLDPNNNKAFLDGQISLTNNGISIYYAAKNAQDPKVRELAADIGHANYPIGPVGRPTELHLFTQAMVFRYSKFPNAAKAFVAFMMEKEQYEPWQQAAIGYITQPLKAYESNPIWTVDPKHTPYRDCVAKMTPHSYAGPLGYASAAAMADFILVNMVAEAASGARSPKEAAERAAARASRYYKV